MKVVGMCEASRFGNGVSEREFLVYSTYVMC
jgi:hypothetical protein